MRWTRILVVLATIATALAIGSGAASAQDASCTQTGSTLQWQVANADGGVVHVRQVTANGSSWVARVQGDSFTVDDGSEYLVRYRVNGQRIDLPCTGDGGGEEPTPVVCFEIGSSLIWGTPDVDLINDRYNIRRVVDNGSTWDRTVPASPAVAPPDVVENFVTGIDRTENYILRYWFLEGDARVFIDVPCGSWFAGQPVAPGAFTGQCLQEGRLVSINDFFEPDRGKYFLRTGTFDDSRWVATVNHADISDNWTLLPTADRVFLRYRFNDSTFNEFCDTRFE